MVKTNIGVTLNSSETQNAFLVEGREEDTAKELHPTALLLRWA